MAKIYHEITDWENWGDQDTMRENMWGQGLRAFNAILECDTQEETNFLDLCAEYLNLRDESQEYSWCDINDFFWHEALELLDDNAESKSDQKPSELVLKYFKKD